MRPVSDTGDRIVVQSDGTLRVVGRGAERRLRDRAGEYTIVADVPGLLLLQREGGDDPGAKVLMAGQILHGMTVMEIINLIATANWRGELHVIGGDAERILTFDGAALKNAQSTHPHDRLGEVLYRLGVLDRSQLEGVLRDVSPDRRFGKMLVEQGLVSQEDLFKYLQRQAEQVFFSSLLVASGHYVFALPSDDGEALSTTLHIPIQHLLMEGVQQVDEMGLFRERIPSSQMCPEVKPDAKAKTLDPTATTVLAYCDGERTIDDIARETGLGEFQATKAIYHLLQQGQVVLRTAARVEPEQVRALLDPINDVMRDIFMAAATYGGLARTQEAVGHWIATNGHGRLLGEGASVEVDGSLDAEQVVSALRSVGSERPMEDLNQALQQLVAYALFTVTSQLNRDQERSLTRDVQRRLKAIA
jgi:hypothetical protein